MTTATFTATAQELEIGDTYLSPLSGEPRTVLATGRTAWTYTGTGTPGIELTTDHGRTIFPNEDTLLQVARSA